MYSASVRIQWRQEANASDDDQPLPVCNNEEQHRHRIFPVRVQRRRSISSTYACASSPLNLLSASESDLCLFASESALRLWIWPPPLDLGTVSPTTTTIHHVTDQRRICHLHLQFYFISLIYFFRKMLLCIFFINSNFFFYFQFCTFSFFNEKMSWFFLPSIFLMSF
jgi:hypothetical protein